MRDFAFLHEEGGSAESEEGGLLPEDLIRRLRTLGLQHRMRDLTDRIRHVEEQGADVSPLLGEKQRLAAELRALQPGGATSDGNF
jgi:hypothetical protein